MSLREPLSRMAASVCVAASGAPGAAHGVTLTSVVGLALEPPLLGLALRRGSRMLARLACDPRLGITVLGAAQQLIAAHCATAGRGPLDESLLERGADGVARVAGGAAWFQVVVTGRVPAGDHDFLIARVVAAGAGASDPLVYQGRRYALLSPADAERMRA